MRDRFLANKRRIRFHNLAIILLVYGGALAAPDRVEPMLSVPRAVGPIFSGLLALAWWLWPGYKGWVAWQALVNALLVPIATCGAEWLAAIIGVGAFRTAQSFAEGKDVRDRGNVAALLLTAISLGVLPFREHSPAGFTLPAVTAAVAALAGSTIGRLSWAADKDQEELAGFRVSSARLAEANVRLQDYNAALEDLTIAQERNRVAREIHDTLGHTLTSILVKLEALDTMILRYPERAIAEVESIIKAVLEGLSDVRASINALRAPHRDGLTGKEQWLRLMRAFAETTGVVVEPIVREPFDDLPEKMNHAIYRAIQEGLTNAYRHGNASKVSVDVWHERGLLMAVISDNGRGLPQPVELDDRPGAGHGLRGIKERVAELGGKVAWRSQPGRGFDLGLEIPYDREGGKSAADSRPDRRRS
ncbi:MAG: sensor histidine kinase [Bacteroidota bacterium]